MKKTLLTLALGSLTFCSGCFTTSVTYVQPEVQIKQPVNVEYVVPVHQLRRAPGYITFYEYTHHYHNPIEKVRIIQNSERARFNPAPGYNTIIITPKSDYRPEHRPDKKHENHPQYQPKRR